MCTQIKAKECQHAVSNSTLFPSFSILLGCAGSELWRAGSFIAAHRLSSCREWAPQVAARGLTCPSACGILVPRPTQWSNPHPLHYKADSELLDHQGTPSTLFFFFFFIQYYLLEQFLFNWRIIALQYCVGFCHISAWVSDRYTYVPCLLNLLPTSHPILPFSVVTDPWF